MRAILLLFIYFLFFIPLYSQPSEEIRVRIELIDRYKSLQFEGIPVITKESLKEFYNSRLFEPAWKDKAHITELLIALSKADEEGLNPSDYFYNELQALISQSYNPEQINPELDILLTQSFLMYGSHLLHGKVDPVSLDPYWRIKKKEKNIVKLLSEALEEDNIRAALMELNPDFPAYIRLKDYLRQFTRLSAEGIDWQHISKGTTLKPGMVDDRILLIKNRLAALGDLSGSMVSEDSLYNESLLSAVQQFQARHGLTADGAIGDKTMAALNISLEERIRKVIINMERCRWLPEDLGENYIIVNIAAFYLRYFKNKQLIKEMDVVVGKPYRQTPVFSATMTYLVFNPYWFIPPTILREDMLPALRKDPNYLDKMNIKVVQGGAFGEVVPSATIDWKEMKASSFPYTLRQEPGNNNALGMVKFMFPNEFNVYLHDTNKRELFQQEARDLSSGCIRVSQPKVLAQEILGDEWSEERINKIIAKEKNYTVKIKDPVLVHLEYWTVFTDSAGKIHFRRDIYERDGKVWAALKKDPV